jgi:hypothetical protein
MFAEAFHSTIKGIHLALEVKASFDNFTSAMGFSTESSTQKPVLPLTTIIGLAGKERRGGTCTHKITKQS